MDSKNFGSGYSECSISIVAEKNRDRQADTSTIIGIRYVEVNITNFGSIEDEMGQQMAEASRSAGRFNLQKQTYSTIKSSLTATKAAVRAIMRNTAETRLDTSKAEAKTIRILKQESHSINENIM